MGPNDPDRQSLTTRGGMDEPAPGHRATGNKGGAKVVEDYSRQIADLFGLQIPAQATNVRHGSNFRPPYAAAVAGPGIGIEVAPGQPMDPRLLTHELAHVYTLRSGQPAPQWLVEGIADYASNKTTGQLFLRGAGDPREGYAPGATFIDWLDRKNSGAAAKLAQALNDGTYNPQWFKEQFGQTPHQAMEEFKPENLPPPPGLSGKVDVRDFPAALSKMFVLSPYAWRVARTVADYHAASLIIAGHGPVVNFAGDAQIEAGKAKPPAYGLRDFMADVEYALQQDPSYLDQLEAKTQAFFSRSRSTSGPR